MNELLEHGVVGMVTHVRDGDTIDVRGVPVRIANLDCAERGTSAGDRATTTDAALGGRRVGDMLAQGSALL
jgi:endonuclease YncB( thermonuclease family)